MDRYQELWSAVQLLGPTSAVDPVNLQPLLAPYRSKLTHLLQQPVRACASGAHTSARRLPHCPSRRARSTDMLSTHRRTCS